MIENKSISQAKYARNLNIVIITVILSLLVILPQYGLGQIAGLAPKYKYIERFFSFIDSNNLYFLLIVYSTALTLILAYIFARFGLKRNNHSLGLVDNEVFKSYGKGILLGFILLTLVVISLKLIGFAEIRKNEIDLKLFLAFLPAWMIQGFEEEFLLRAILMNQMAARSKIGLSIIANSLIFSILHLGNAGFSPMAFVNIFLVGVIFSLVFYISDSIYMSAGAHTFWNMTMANIFGITVSGYKPIGETILKTSLKGPALISGGDFGLEGSIITSLVLVGILIILMRKIKQKDSAK